jgi:predicted glutamine amidotransferase
LPNLLAMSFEGALSPSFDLRCLKKGRDLPDGWGMGYYPGGEPSATVLKEPAPPPGGIRSELVRTWDHVASSVFLLHIRAARWGSVSDANTQPFCRSWGRRDWMFTHSGSLDQRLEPGPSPTFEPVGSTDTETIFCELMNRIADARWKRLRDVDPRTLHGWFDSLDQLGVLTCAVTDGSDIVVYVDRNHEQPAYIWEILPPYEHVIFGDDDLQVDLTRRDAKARKGVIIASNPLDAEG